jgi:hypothetical protein
VERSARRDHYGFPFEKYVNARLGAEFPPRFDPKMDSANTVNSHGNALGENTVVEFGHDAVF